MRVLNTRTDIAVKNKIKLWKATLPQLIFTTRTYRIALYFQSTYLGCPNYLYTSKRQHNAENACVNGMFKLYKHTVGSKFMDMLST